MGRSQGKKSRLSNHKMASTLLGGSDASIRGSIDLGASKEKRKIKELEKLLKELAHDQQMALVRGEVSSDPNKLSLDGDDLSGRALYGLNLTGSSFAGANFQDADLGHPSQGLGSILDNADLKNADFKQANLEGVSFQSANLEGAALASASITGADFWQSNIKGAEFNHSYIAEAAFIEADANKKTSFTGVEFEETRFGAVCLDNVSFINSSFRSCKFIKCSLNKALFKGVDMDDVTFSVAGGINLEGSDFGAGYLHDVHFVNDTNFKEANFTNATVLESTFTNTDFAGADLTDAIFKDQTTFINPEFKFDTILAGTVFEDCVFIISDPKKREGFQSNLEAAGATLKNCTIEEA